MPKVSQEHLDRRRQQIIDAAVDCFARDGYHATSMQDIFATADLSAGAVYRYFPSKASLFLAISSEVLCSTRGVLDDAIADAARATESADPALAPSIADIVALIVTRMGTAPLARLRPVVLEVWAEAARDAEVRDLVLDIFRQLSDLIERLLRLHIAVGRLPEGTDTAALARLIIATVQGYMAQLSVLPELDGVAAAARTAFGEI